MRGEKVNECVGGNERVRYMYMYVHVSRRVRGWEDEVSEGNEG